jgi:arylsulfatase A-like enzyme
MDEPWGQRRRTVKVDEGHQARLSDDLFGSVTGDRRRGYRRLVSETTPHLGSPGGRPNILLITTDEQRWSLPTPKGFTLPARDWLAERGTTFDRYYVASAMCSSSRSVMYTGRHVPITQIYDNDNMPYIRPLDPSLGTLGTMMRAAGYYTSYQGKWHLSNAYLTPTKRTSTVDELEPYGFAEFNDWGDIDGGAWGAQDRPGHRRSGRQVTA